MSHTIHSLVTPRRLTFSSSSSNEAANLRRSYSRLSSSIPRLNRALTAHRKYSTIHPSHKPIVQLPTKEQEEAEKLQRPARAVNIIGLTRTELEEEFQHFNFPKYRATQVFQWLYGQGATRFEDMPNIGKNLISQLNEKYYIDYGSTAADSTSNDGTRKWLVDLGSKQCVEST